MHVLVTSRRRHHVRQTFACARDAHRTHDFKIPSETVCSAAAALDQCSCRCFLVHLSGPAKARPIMLPSNACMPRDDPDSSICAHVRRLVPRCCCCLVHAHRRTHMHPLRRKPSEVRIAVKLLPLQPHALLVLGMDSQCICRLQAALCILSMPCADLPRRGVLSGAAQ